MDPLFLNNSCDPFSSRELPCLTGAYVQYAVNVSEPRHVLETINFVKRQNIRFVVKNTGHDYMGRSTGTGAVSVWMHHLRNITWEPQFTSSNYNGPAFKASAGVRGIDLVLEANKRGLVVVVGDCPTVGIAGGYTQGGGHSPLSSLHGLAADQALEYEVITTQGRFVVASRTQNQDLYWALSGGGGGTYGIVWSVTVKAYPDLPVTIATLQFNATGISQELYWKAVEAYQSSTPKYTDAKAWILTSYTNESFSLNPFFAINKSPAQVETLIQPLLQSLDSLGIDYTSSIRPFNTYLEAYSDFLLHLPGFNILLGSRVLTRSIWNDEATLAELVDIIKGIVDGGAAAFDLAMRPTLEVAGYPKNSVHPAWRDSEKLFVFSMYVCFPFSPGLSSILIVTYALRSVIDDGESVEQMQANLKRINSLEAALKRFTPGSVAYMNEANVGDPDFKEAFYGTRYRSLLAIKRKWDPDHVLYGSTSVGGDEWREMDDGRLCRTNAMVVESNQIVL
ncbi:hypothetical protein AAF712_008586 [Marasmius tenuissimus]|uniref:FAD-binding PCMH-type domain-containing protein n=1 Tax=Marasmius tenuissimus TaxID=585030 RepID=A0ABR2ZVU9_9AGAR